MRSEAYRIGLAFGTGLEKNAGFLGRIGRLFARGPRGMFRHPMERYPAALQQKLREAGKEGLSKSLLAGGVGYGLYHGMGAPATPPPFDPAPFMQMMASMQQQQQQPNPDYGMPREINILR